MSRAADRPRGPQGQAGLTRKNATTITHDGTTTSFPVTHNLGTTDIQVILRDSTGAEVLVDNVATSATVATLNFGSAQPNGTTFRVIVQG